MVFNESTAYLLLYDYFQPKNLNFKTQLQTVVIYDSYSILILLPLVFEKLTYECAFRIKIIEKSRTILSFIKRNILQKT